MASLASIEKQNQFVIFNLIDGTSVRYDLERDVTIGKKGDPVRGLNSQLRGIQLEAVKDLFKDQGFYEYLLRLQTAKTYPSYTLSGVLSRVIEFPHLEGYVRLGIKAETKIGIPVSGVPKNLLNWVRAMGDSAPWMSTNFIQSWKANEPEAQAMLSVRDDLNYRYVDRIVETLLRERGTIRSTYGRFADLFDRYRYDPATLARYLFTVCNYEGLSVDEAVQYLRDYAMMQANLSEGHHSFEKYPRNLMTVHRIAKRNTDRMRKTFDEDAFKATYDNSMETEIGPFTFICPTSSAAIKNEAVQQLHCVAAYIDNVIEGKCHIIFMREKKLPRKSYITLEVVNNRVVQAKGFRDRDITPEEYAFVTRYNAYLQSREAVA